MTGNGKRGAFEDVVRGANPELRAICETLRIQIERLHKGFVEVVWPKFKIASFGVGPRKMTEHYAYIAVQRSHVNLGFYHGASLKDPRGLLEGTGKKLRHVKLHTVKEATTPEITALLRQAIAERRPVMQKNESVRS
jgi:hypothetical protein